MTKPVQNHHLLSEAAYVPTELVSKCRGCKLVVVVDVKYI